MSSCRVEIHAAVPTDDSECIRTILDTHCPSLTNPSLASMVPTPYLVGGMLQTAYSALRTLKRDAYSNITYDRETKIMSDGGTVSLDWYPQQKHNSRKPIAIVMAGVGGSSYEYHIRSLVKALAGGGFTAVVMNHRGLGRTPLTSPKLYNGGDTGDFRDTLIHIHDCFPEAPLVAVAFSMGATLLTKYLGEQPGALLSGAIAICCPFDMSITGRMLDADTFVFNRFVRPMAVASQLRLVKRNYDMIKRSGFDMDALMNAKRLSEIDTLVTARALGFKDCWELYAASSTTKYLSEIRVPFLVINSMDDPVVPPHGLPLDKIKSNPLAAMALVRHGGHLGFFTGVLPRIWYLTPVVEFLQAIALK
ncbi:hypothetical protein GGI20_002133 [Coemansia sp. BCRC 34301]|nr:hypothetical protein GGI20_002133 [Coemansia sp. BCRC 34301]